MYSGLYNNIRVLAGAVDWTKRLGLVRVSLYCICKVSFCMICVCIICICILCICMICICICILCICMIWYLYLYLYGSVRLIGQNGCDLSECRDYRRRPGDGRITGGLLDYRPPASETIRFTDFYEHHQITLGDSIQLQVVSESWKVETTN